MGALKGKQATVSSLFERRRASWSSPPSSAKCDQQQCYCWTCSNSSHSKLDVSSTPVVDETFHIPIPMAVPPVLGSEDGFSSTTHVVIKAVPALAIII